MSSSEDEDIIDNYSTETLELKGFLSKWTNYINGWQTRYIVLKGSTLSYYKSEEESDFGCRGAIALEKAMVKESEIDECRFEIYVDNLVWYLRTDRPEDRRYWVDVLRSFKINDEILHNASDNLSTTSGSSSKHTSRILQLKMNEIETYRDILNEQISSLQQFFDNCTNVENLKLHQTAAGTDQSPAELNIIDFKGEAITFKETTTAVLIALNHCLEILSQKEDSMKKKIEREVSKRKKVEEELKKCQEEIIKSKASSLIGPDHDLEAEGPNSTIPEDEFFDAVETGLEKIEEVCNIRMKLKLQNQQSQTNTEVEKTADEHFGDGKAAAYHWLWPEISKICKEQIHHAITGVDSSAANGWQIFAEEGEMKMYRREEEINGIVTDPLKSCHVVKGCTAREMCYIFFHPSFRNDWETTLEDCSILEEISRDTMVFLQTHKRIWPANQRDALFWSHMEKIDDMEPGATDAWMVCNQSTEGPNYPTSNQGKCIRIYLTVILLCQTFVTPPKDGEEITRDNLTCKITYCSVVNPGGWVKPTLLRAVYKKEYPKFLKRFTSYVLETVKNKPIKF